MTYENAVKALSPIQRELSAIAGNQDEILEQLAAIRELLRTALCEDVDEAGDARSVPDVCGDLLNLIMVRIFPNNDAIASELVRFKTVLSQIDTATRGNVKLYS